MTTSRGTPTSQAETTRFQPSARANSSRSSGRRRSRWVSAVPSCSNTNDCPQRTTASSSRNSRSMESPPAGPPPSSSTSPACSGKSGGSGWVASRWPAPPSASGPGPSSDEESGANSGMPRCFPTNGSASPGTSTTTLAPAFRTFHWSAPTRRPPPPIPIRRRSSARSGSSPANWSAPFRNRLDAQSRRTATWSP